MDKQRAPSISQRQERNQWDVEKRTGHVGGALSNMQGCNEESQDPPGIVTGKVPQGQQKRTSTSISAAKGKLGIMLRCC